MHVQRGQFSSFSLPFLVKSGLFGVNPDHFRTNFFKKVRIRTKVRKKRTKWEHCYLCWICVHFTCSRELKTKLNFVSSVYQGLYGIQIGRGFFSRLLFRMYGKGWKIKLIIFPQRCTHTHPPPSRKIINFFPKFFYWLKMMYMLWNGFCMIWEIHLSIFWHLH